MTLDHRSESPLIPFDPATLSIVSPEVALQRPIGELVEDTLVAAGRSDHTRRSYRTGISFFLQFLEAERGQLLPPAAATWRPFAEAAAGRYGKTEWTYRAPAGVLRLVDAALLDRFRAAPRARTPATARMPPRSGWPPFARSWPSPFVIAC